MHLYIYMYAKTQFTVVTVLCNFFYRGGIDASKRLLMGKKVCLDIM